METPTLHTERLTLRPLRPDQDAAALHAIYRDPQAMRFMPTLLHEHPTETRDLLHRETAIEGSHHWVVCLRDDEQVIGYVNYLGQTRLPGMGYLIAPSMWGQGFAPEACRAVLDDGFARLGYAQVELWIDQRNTASQRVAQKLGFGLKGQIAQRYAHRATHHTMLVWGIWAHEWQGTPPPPPAPRFFQLEPVLLTHDVAQTVAFYRDQLGFRLDYLYGEPPDHAAVSRGEWTGGMVVIQISHCPPDYPLTPSVQLYLLVDSQLDQLCEQYQAKGVEITSEPTNYPWGMREFTVRDPNGYLLRFGTHAFETGA